MRNKLLLSLVLAAATSSVFAMPYDPSKHDGILEVALTGGGFKANTDHTAYGINTSVVSATDFYPSGAVLKNDPEYKFGGTVLLGYYFPDSTINVDLSYTGLRNHLFDSASGTLSPRFVPNDIGSEVTYADSSYDFDYDFVNVEIGSLTRVNSNGLIINPQLGLSYARLKQDQLVGYAGTAALGTDVAIAEQHASFNGFGPSIGVDLNFVVCQPITLSGNFRYNALVGNVNSSSRYLTSNAAEPFYSVGNQSHDTLVSLFQTELALGYDFNLSNMFCGNLAIGYQLTKALDNGEQYLPFSHPAGGRAPGFTDDMTNSSIHGYFVRLTMDFHV